MKNIKILLLVITIIILSISCFVLYKQNTKIEVRYEGVVNDVMEAYFYQNLKINNSEVYYNNDTLNIINLFDIKEPSLVFRYSAYDCDKCVDFIIKKIKQHFPYYIENIRIIFLASDIEPRLREGFYDKKKNKS